MVVFHLSDEIWFLSSLAYAILYYSHYCLSTERWLSQSDIVKVGEEILDAFHYPGRTTPGHVIFVHHDTNLAIVGDVLFKGSMVEPFYQKEISIT